MDGSPWIRSGKRPPILGWPARAVNLRGRGARRPRPRPGGPILRVAIAQIHPRLGDLEANLALHREWIVRARVAGASLLVFPELSLTGYALRDLVTGVAVPLRGGPLEALAREAGPMAVAVGAVLASRTGPPSNAAVWLEKGKAAFVHRKVYLPNHGMFEEARYFSPGDRFRVHRSKAVGMSAGLLVCRDLWHLSSGMVLAYRGLDLLVALSASPGRDLSGGEGEDAGFGSLRMLRVLNEASARCLGVFVIHANRVGTEEGVTFAGGSEIWDPTGRLLARGAEDAEDLVTADLDPDLLRRARTALPLERDEKRDLVAREVRDALRERGRRPQD
jgi:predicted amidohydrolase